MSEQNKQLVRRYYAEVLTGLMRQLTEEQVVTYATGSHELRSFR